MSRLTRDGTAEPVSRDRNLRRERGQGNMNFPCSADHELVDPCSREMCHDRYINTYHTGYATISTVLFSRQDSSVCFLPIHSGHQVRWTYQPGSHRRKVTQEEGHTGGRSHRRKVTQDFSSTFFLRCVPYFFSREGFCHSFPSSTVKSNFVY